MKRTAAITLALLGALSVTGCAEKKIEPTTYTNVVDCTADGNSRETCVKAFEDAQKATAENAPKFNSAEACQAQFGSCQQSASGGWFMPALMGYMIGSMNSGGSNRYYSSPVYHDRSGRPVAASFSNGTYKATSAAPSYSSRVQARAAAAKASTSSRGGFGSSARSASS